jgi:hypothetical protein
MPRGRALDQSEKDLLFKWRADGLLEECSSDPQFGGVTLDAIETKILEDLTRIDPFSRNFIRYFVVRDGFQAGINKGINSVSLANNILNPEQVDARLGLYRIDLEQYELTRNDWRVIESFDDIDFESFSSKGLLIKALTNARKPWLHGRNFSFISHKTAIYYFLLDIPRTLAEFERLDFIDVDLSDEFRRLRPRLMGFNGSPISLNKNRLIGRFESQEGYLWFTWDVLDVANRGSNLFEEPLIKDAGGQASFVFDGSEAIFTLPNGLQGYALFDGAGARVNEAPVTLVFDTESPFDPEIANGLDCHRCHASGLLAAEDQIRDHVERNAGQFDGRDVQLVQFLFPRNELPLFNIDNNFFKRALDEVGQESVDSVNESTDYLRNDYLAEKVAELLFVTPSQLSSCINSSGVLQAQIGQLITGGTVTFGQLSESLPDLFRECGFNDELFYP